MREGSTANQILDTLGSLAAVDLDRQLQDSHFSGRDKFAIQVSSPFYPCSLCCVLCVVFFQFLFPVLVSSFCVLCLWVLTCFYFSSLTVRRVDHTRGCASGFPTEESTPVSLP